MVLFAPAGASFTPVTLIVIVLGDWSRSTPPLPVPPSSCTWNVKLASADPVALAAGVNASWPALMSATVTNWPAVTAMPLLVSVPDARVGIVVISAVASVLAGLSFGSVKPNSSAVKVWAVSSLVVIVLSVPAGASFTLEIGRASWREGWSVSAPPLATPRLSLTWNVKLASGDPLAFAAGVNTSRPALMSATVTNWPAVTAMLLLVSVPGARVGIVVGLPAAAALAGLSFGSVKPNSSAVKVWAVSSLVVIVLSVPAGASFTLVTLIVIVLADWSVSTRSEERRVGTVSWNVKLASGDTLAFAGVMDPGRPAWMS